MVFDEAAGIDGEETELLREADPSLAAEAATVARAADGSEAVLVPAGGCFEGQVAIVGLTRIEGSVRGSLRGPGQLLVGPDARVEGRIECESLESRGEIVGPVAVRTRARLGGRGRLDGDLRAPSVVLEDEAVWNGRAVVGCEADVGDPDDQAEGEAEATREGSPAA